MILKGFKWKIGNVGWVSIYRGNWIARPSTFKPFSSPAMPLDAIVVLIHNKKKKKKKGRMVWLSRNFFWKKCRCSPKHPIDYTTKSRSRLFGTMIERANIQWKVTIKCPNRWSFLTPQVVMTVNTTIGVFCSDIIFIIPFNDIRPLTSYVKIY